MGAVVFESSHWPNWVQTAELLAAFALTAGFGIHAYSSHKLESDEAVSPRKWMYWLYSMVFLVASVANFAQLCIATMFREYGKASFHLGYTTVLLSLSYVALLAGVRRKPGT